MDEKNILRKQIEPTAELEVSPGPPAQELKAPANQPNGRPELSVDELLESATARHEKRMAELARQNESRREIGYLRSRFEYTPIEQLLDDERKALKREEEQSRKAAASNTRENDGPVVRVVVTHVLSDERTYKTDREKSERQDQRDPPSAEPPGPPGSESGSKKAEKRIADQLSNGKEMSEAKHARLQRLMNADYHEAANELTFDRSFDRGRGE